MFINNDIINKNITSFLDVKLLILNLLTTSVVYWFTFLDMLFVLLNVLVSDLLYKLFSTYAFRDLELLI